MKNLSPTALMQYEDNPYEFYMQRVAEQRMERVPQADFFALGSAFDTLIKVWFAHRLGQSLSPTLFEDQVEAQHLKGPVLRKALYLFASYLDSPAAQWVMDRGLQRVEDNVDQLLIVDPRTPDRAAFPLWGKPDASFAPTTPFDFKTTSTGQVALGYKYLWVNDNGVWKQQGPHPRAMEPLESLHQKWALQMCSYGWLFGHPVGIDMPAVVHQIALGEQVQIACYDTIITGEYQHQLAQRYHDCWDAYQNGTLVPKDEEWARIMAG